MTLTGEYSDRYHARVSLAYLVLFRLRSLQQQAAQRRDAVVDVLDGVEIVKLDARFGQTQNRTFFSVHRVLYVVQFRSSSVTFRSVGQIS